MVFIAILNVAEFSLGLSWFCVIYIEVVFLSEGHEVVVRLRIYIVLQVVSDHFYSPVSAYVFLLCLQGVQLVIWDLF